MAFERSTHAFTVANQKETSLSNICATNTHKSRELIIIKTDDSQTKGISLVEGIGR